MNIDTNLKMFFSYCFMYEIAGDISLSFKVKNKFNMVYLLNLSFNQ